MRIISNFHDYYDGVARSWDPTGEVCTYIREKQEAVVAVKDTALTNGISDYGDSFSGFIRVEPGIIGFCGQIYPYVQFSDREKGLKEFCYDMDTLLKFISFNRNGIVEFNTSRRVARRWRYISLNRRWFENWFTGELSKGWYTDARNFKPFYESLFREYSVPIFNHGPSGAFYKDLPLVLNACLQDYQFYRVVDCTQAVQRLEMYLTNDLAPRDEVSMNISDELKAHSHGFDKHSFRTPKSK